MAQFSVFIEEEMAEHTDISKTPLNVTNIYGMSMYKVLWEIRK